jgi:pimeloyl-ACP methyl ester carboxylesterase
MVSEVEFRGEDGARLAGSLVVPDGVGAAVFPAALILSGSGPLDRNSNMRGQKLDLANALADLLAERGIATVRYDKRGVGESDGDYLETGFDTETSDAASALAWLGGRAGIDGTRLAVVGHSVGATIAVRLASSSAAVAGIVLLAGAVRTGDEVMRHQSDRIAATLIGLQRLGAGWFLRRQERARRTLGASTGHVVRIGRQRLPARWFREYMRYDPAGDLERITCPVLAITGRNDVQVDADDVERIGELVRGPFTGLTPEALTHLLRTHPKPGLGGYAAQLKQPVDREVLAAVATWLSEVLGPVGDTA